MPWRKSELIHYILWIVLEYKSSPDHSILEMPPLGSNHYSILEAAGHSPAFQSSQFLIPPQPCQFHCLTTYTNIWNIIKRVGVLRDTARAPQPPSNRAPNEPARPFCAQESIFWGKSDRFWAKNLIFKGGRKSFGTHLTKKTPRHFSCSFF